MADADDARAWDERLGWAFGLIADDPQERGPALVRLTEARRKVSEALARYNETLWLASHLGTEEQRHDSALRQAFQVYYQARRRSLPDGLWEALDPGELATWPGLPYALLFLEWEAKYPQAWTCHAKAWGTKQSLIRDLAAARLDEASRAKLTDLVEIVVHRAHRCKDREYARIARAVDGADLRDRLRRAAESDSPWARCQAGYVLWLLDRPDLPNSRHVWREWLAGRDSTDAPG
ncbi:hypothetical protein RZ50_007740 [Kitasatospora sp. SUK 42]|nr:hypothetical protein [Kitasatospora sp. SUK 42]